MEMRKLEDLPKAARIFGMSYINVWILDCAGNYHVCAYDDETKKYTDFNSKQEIIDPVLWGYLPSFNDILFQSEIERLYEN